MGPEARSPGDRLLLQAQGDPAVWAAAIAERLAGCSLDAGWRDPLEMDTALRHDLPFVAVVGNDARWNAEVQIQHRTYGADRAIGCDLRASRYDELVRALDAHGTAVESAAELPAALEAAHASGIAACVNVSLQPVAAPIITRH